MFINKKCLNLRRPLPPKVKKVEKKIEEPKVIKKVQTKKVEKPVIVENNEVKES